ncbi:HlyD family secretion protein [Rubripirellula tenax]|uniref:HlyD family secretion protein n=2 Tax=Rubripirellula tenax TaxID=2528015 RepID=A0A5C6E7G5_9BACT|nr:HlyD family secretion protein [Rubripirellula tenax]
MAEVAEDRTDFYKRLAAEIVENFRCGLVAIEAAHWSAPMMLVADPALSSQISRDELLGLLASASSSPVACNIPIETDSDSNNESIEFPAGDAMARGLRIEVAATPSRAALLLVYPLRSRPSAITQIEDLRLLQTYGEAARSLVDQFPVASGKRSTTAPSDTVESQQLIAPEEPRGLAGNRSLRVLHLDLDLDATCFRIANESRRLLGSDRVTVLKRRGSKLRVAAVSGVTVVDKRGNAVRCVERLTNAAVVMSRPLVLPGGDLIPPQIQQPLDDYLDETAVTSAIILPLHVPSEDADGVEAGDFDPFSGDGPCIGVIMLEYFGGDVPASVTLPMNIVASEATLALRNSLEHQSVFGLGLWKGVGKLIGNGRLPWVVAALIALASMATASVLINVTHHVVVSGTAEPSHRRDVFATIDGTVKNVLVNDGQYVQAGDVLVALENADLESRAEALWGEIQTAISRLASIEAVRLSGESDPSQSGRMAIELMQVESELANLRGQRTILAAQQKELQITSPISGQVVGWQLSRRLADRPIGRGNLLVSVVDPTGPWTLKLKVPDRDAGTVIEASKSNPQLPIEFAVATLPESTFSASLEEIATASRMDDTGQQVVDAAAVIHMDPENVVRFDSFNASEMRSGADVTAKIACGRRSILRSWFGDVFDFVHRNVLFYF